MFTQLIDDDIRHSDMYDDHPDDANWCRHGNRYSECETCDDECGDIDKCLNCGRYRASSSLNRDQCCAKGCTNPNEY